MSQLQFTRTNQLEPASHGSRTMTLTQPESSNEPEAGPSSEQPTAGVLRLRGTAGHRQRVQWEDGTVDNEGLGRKKSKICCIYHKPKKFDESSDESDSDASSCGSDASSCGSDDSTRPHRHPHNHNHNHPHPHSHDQPPASTQPAGGSGTELEPPSHPAPPNAYERQPNNANKGKGKATGGL